MVMGEWENGEWGMELSSHLSSGLRMPYPMMKCSFSRLVVGLCRATELSAPPSPWITSTMSDDSFDFFLRVMEAIRFLRLSFFLSSRVGCGERERGSEGVRGWMVCICIHRYM